MLSKTLVAASTKPVILSILVWGEDYGYQIIQRVKKISGGALEWSDNMLYPVLHRVSSGPGMAQ
jgi:DNA-binding PadR family transcriptional regulator